jgi:hypothetical protein
MGIKMMKHNKLKGNKSQLSCKLTSQVNHHGVPPNFGSGRTHWFSAAKACKKRTVILSE